MNGFDKNSVAQEEVQWRRVVEMGFAVFDQRDCSVKPAYELSPIELPGAGPKNKFICCMECQKWFDSFLTNEIVALTG